MSPDGQTIAFLYDSNHTIRLVSRKGVLVRDIRIAGDVPLQSLDWTPDGLGFISTQTFGTMSTQNGSAILYIPLNGPPRVLWRGSHTTIWTVPSHDGRRLAVFSLSQTSDVWTVDGF